MQKEKYQFTEKIHESANSIIYRGLDVTKDMPVIIKVLNEKYLSQQGIVKYKREYELTHSIQSDHVIKVIELLKHQEMIAIVEEDIEGQSLRDIMKHQRLSLEDTLVYGIEICKALSEIHQLGITHKDIKPDNIIINPKTGVTKLIDFAFATTQPIEMPTIKHHQQIEGSLNYISPEQTGRMNRVVDYRTDFYALGVTLYEMLTDKLPFTSNDPLEVIHAHIARHPVTPYKINKKISQVVSNIVMKLLAKSASHRYQSAWGIQADLQNCLDQLRSQHKIKSFKLNEADIADRLIISHKIVGRDQEIKQLLEYFSKVNSGENQFVLVTGYSGIGKTSLIHEVDKELTKKHGFFIQGKYDQYLQHVPYSAISNAFKELVKYLLCENEIKLAEWRKIIQQTLGNDINLIIDLIPDFELLIEKTPTSSENNSISWNEKEFRLNHAFSNLIKIFSQKDHPLIFFLDDLQWIDNASLTLLKKLMLNKEVQYLLFIGAYRNNEVNATHPLAKTIESLENEDVRLHKIMLLPLENKSIESFIADSLHLEHKKVTQLVELIAEKTGGNPFFIIQFLYTLHERKLLKFNVDSKQWTWNLEKIKEENFTDNVIDLMIKKLTSLPEQTQYLLSIAACLGNQFDLRNVALIYEKSLALTYQDLYPAIRAGYLLLTSGLQLSSNDLIQSKLVAFNLKFMHDRIQQAAYIISDKSVISSHHFKIAELLLKNLSAEEQDQQLFEIVNHLDLAGDRMVSKNKTLLVQLHIKAAAKAKKSGAYESALWYLKKGMKYLSKRSWNDFYDFTLNVYKERIELEFINGNFQEMQIAFKTALKNVKTKFEKINLYVIPITQLLFQGKISEAIQLDKKVLKLIGISIPKSFELKKAIKKEKAKLDKYLSHHTVTSLLNLKPMQDQEKGMVLWLLYKMGAATHFEDVELETYISLMMVNFCIENGNDRFSIAAYFVYGHIAITYFNDYTSANDFTQLSLDLCDKYQEHALKTAALFFQSLIMPLSKHIKHSIPPLEECYQLALSTGELEFGMYSVTNRLLNLQFGGMPLDRMIKEAKETAYILSRYKYKIMYAYVLAQMLLIKNLNGSAKDLSQFKSDDSINENSLLKLCNQFKLDIVLKRYYFYKAIALYLYGKTSEALKFIEKSKIDTLHINKFHIIEVEYIFYYALIILDGFKNASVNDQANFRKTIANLISQLEIWCKNSPVNFACMYTLVKAELARIDGRLINAIELYNQATQSALENGFIQHAALAQELQGKFWLSLDNDETSKVFIHNARNLYAEWGANAKVELMLDQYPKLLTYVPYHGNFLSKEKLSSSSDSVTSNFILDLRSLLKSSQAISSEISLPRLIKKLLLVLVENIGAQRGVLLLKNNEQWFVEGEYHTRENKSINMLNSIPINVEKNLPIALIKSVIKSKEYSVHINASSDESLMHDPYIKNNKIKSLLCAPILIHNELIGIFYFENNLISGVFTPERLEVLNILSAQITISIENAKLYKSFEAFVPQEFLSNLHKKNIMDILPGDHIQRNMTIMFSDIRDFTTLSEKMTSQQTFELINKFLEMINPIIKAHGGFIDKYLGDGFMALFPSSPDSAIAAAIAMKNELRRFNSHQKKLGENEINVGFGIHWGQLILGTVGNKDRMNGTVISDAVNFASRLEGCTKFFGCDILISDRLLQQLANKKQFETRFLGKIKAKGKQVDMMIHEVLVEDDPNDFAKIKVKSTFADALNLYLNKQIQEAYEKFEIVLKVAPNDTVAKIYLGLAQDYLYSGSKRWSSVVELFEK